MAPRSHLTTACARVPEAPPPRVTWAKEDCGIWGLLGSKAAGCAYLRVAEFRSDTRRISGFNRDLLNRVGIRSPAKQPQG